MREWGNERKETAILGPVCLTVSYDTCVRVLRKPSWVQRDSSFRLKPVSNDTLGREFDPGKRDFSH